MKQQQRQQQQQQHIQDHYKILGLPSPFADDRDVTPHEIKLAYRQALLHYHPDKSPIQLLDKVQPEAPDYTVDQIAIAYQTLIDPKRRSEYDRLVRLGSARKGLRTDQSHPGLEIVDLDDLAFDDEQNKWYRSCRCGNEKGYLISEEELERDAEHGEVIIGCGGCSIWLKVIFAVAEDG